ncbi:MAG: PadR family transcriptional regulator [Actinomycetota bacterium]
MPRSHHSHSPNSPTDGEHLERAPHRGHQRRGRHAWRRGGPHGGGRRHRARRGALRDGVITLLGERPMHGYELITELEARSNGRWRPSPGAIYPALRKMEHHGLINSSDDDGTRTFALTDEGQAALTRLEAARVTGAPAPWDDAGAGERGDLRHLMSEIGGQLRQIGRFGTAEQVDATRTILDDTKRQLYAVLAGTPATESTADASADSADSADEASSDSS